MALGYLLVALIAASVAVFALQNSAPASVRFMVWTVEGLPLAAVALVALGAGLVVAGVPLWIGRWRWRSRARACQARIASLERALAEREESRARAELPPPPQRHPPRPEG